MLKALIFAFDDEDGLPEEIYDHARNMLSTMLGFEAVNVFQRYIDATDGRFYFKEGQAKNCWNGILSTAIIKDK